MKLPRTAFLSFTFSPLTLQFPELRLVWKLGHFPDPLYRCVTLLELLDQTPSIFSPCQSLRPQNKYIPQRYDHSVTMTEPNHPPLLILPPEVLGMVCSRLNEYSLTRLMETCKSLNSIASIQLYEHVVLRVPMEWSRLPSLESLISSSGENFSLVRHITIATKHDVLRKNQKEPVYNLHIRGIKSEDNAGYPYTYTESSDYDSEDSNSDWDVVLGHRSKLMLPPPSASRALNVLIRMLVARLPKHRLQTLRYVCPEFILMIHD